MNEQNTSTQDTDASAFQASFEEAAAKAEQPAKAPVDASASSSEASAPAKKSEAPTNSTKPEKDLKTLLAEERAKREKLEAQLRKEKAAQTNPQPDPATDERLIQRFLAAKPEMEAPLCALIRREALKAIRPMAEAIMGEQHIQRIARAHPDWDTLAKSSELTRWIDEQPPYIAKSLRQVVARGHADDVIDLLSRFKEQLKAKADKTTPFDDPATDCALAVPAHSSGLPKAAPDKEDFKNAWREAIAGNDQ